MTLNLNNKPYRPSDFTKNAHPLHTEGRLVLVLNLVFVQLAGDLSRLSFGGEVVHRLDILALLGSSQIVFGYLDNKR